MPEDTGSDVERFAWEEGSSPNIINLYRLLEASARRFPDNPALIFLDRVMDYRELDRRVRAMAAAFQEKGIKKALLSL